MYFCETERNKSASSKGIKAIFKDCSEVETVEYFLEMFHEFCFGLSMKQSLNGGFAPRARLTGQSTEKDEVECMLDRVWSAVQSSV